MTGTNSEKKCEPLNKFQNIILFDGVCVLCNRWANLINKMDANNKFIFIPLQTKEAKNFLNSCGYNPDILDTIYLITDKKIKTKFSASISALYIANPIFFPLALIQYIVPKVILNYFYDLIGNKRYLLFGKQDICYLPSKDELAKLTHVTDRHVSYDKRFS